MTRTEYDVLIESLNDLHNTLVTAYMQAEDLRDVSEPFTQERRLALWLTSDLESMARQVNNWCTTIKMQSQLA